MFDEKKLKSEKILYEKVGRKKYRKRLTESLEVSHII